jgi:hypothetical protein
VGQHEGEVFTRAGIGQPLPGEHALGGDGEVVAEGLDFLEEEGEVVVLDVLMQNDVALAVDDADVHGAGVEVDSAVVLGGGLMLSGGWYLQERWESGHSQRR